MFLIFLFSIFASSDPTQSPTPKPTDLPTGIFVGLLFGCAAAAAVIMAIIGAVAIRFMKPDSAHEAEINQNLLVKEDEHQ